MNAPRDLWIAYRSGDGIERDDAGLLMPFSGVKQIGRSENMLLVDFDGDSVPDLWYQPPLGELGFWIEVYTQPPAGPTPTPGALITLLAAAGLFTRRRCDAEA